MPIFNLRLGDRILDVQGDNADSVIIAFLDHYNLSYLEIQHSAKDVQIIMKNGIPGIYVNPFRITPLVAYEACSFLNLCRRAGKCKVVAGVMA